MKARDLFDFPSSLPFAEFFSPEAWPWDWVPKIKEALDNFDFEKAGKRGDIPPGISIQGPVFIHPTVKLPSYGTIIGPAYIGANSEIRPGAYLRGNVIAGENCILGHAGEYKNCLLLEDVQTPHRPYVGDSVLGAGAHLGAGVVLANLRLDRQTVPVVLPDGERRSSGLSKLGALIGDRAEAGCNAVLQPGTILGRRSIVVPGLAFTGCLPENTLARPSASSLNVPRR